MERTTDVLSPSTSHPNLRHVVYFIALLALLHQFPSVYTSPAVVTALSLPSLLPSPVNTIPRGLNIDCDSDL